AETDDTLLERYLGGEEIGRDEAIAAMKAGMAKGELFPLFCGAAELTYGMRALLAKLVELFPAPLERPPVEAQKWGSAERVTLKAEDTGDFVAQVFKTISEPHVGDVTFFRVYSGTVRNGQDVYNAPREAVEKLNHLCVTQGKERFEIAELRAGDVGAVAKLRDTHTNDTLSTREHAIVLPKIPFPETFRARAEGQGKHKKQTGGRGQYGDCWIRIAPLPRGSGFQFVDEIVGGVIPRQYIPAVERGVQEAAARGPVAGYPVVD